MNYDALEGLGGMHDTAEESLHANWCFYLDSTDISTEAS